MGSPGYNLSKNNGRGSASREAAARASARCSRGSQYVAAFQLQRRCSDTGCNNVAVGRHGLCGPHANEVWVSDKPVPTERPGFTPGEIGERAARAEARTPKVDVAANAAANAARLLECLHVLLGYCESKFPDPGMPLAHMREARELVDAIHETGAR
jgi:hypothetical protein